GLDQFEEIYQAIPVMLCGLTQRGAQLALEQ
ncbi:YecA family protein, partial [Vibrio anguillarum]|nr:YecA family protein [Vibrio anguillarum]